MLYNTGTVTIVSGSAIVKGTGTKWNSNNPLVSAGMLMLIKNGDINYPYMIKAVNSNTELALAEEATFSATDTPYTINLTEPNNNSDAARALVAANTYILYFLQNMDTWMGENGVVELTLPSGKVVKLESIKALQELVKGKADASDIDEIKEAVKGKADASSVEAISKTVADKLDKTDVVQSPGSATDKMLSQKACDDNYAKKNSQEVLRTGNIVIKSGKDYSGLMIERKDGVVCALQTSPDSAYLAYGEHGKLDIPYNTSGIMMVTGEYIVDGNGFVKKASPIIKIYANGNFETNEESEGAKVQRLGTGKYLISEILGYNADGAWGVNGGVSIPKDINGLELVYVKDKILSDGKIEIQTFHRQHAHLPEDFQNWRAKENIDGKAYYVDGEQCDIPPSTWLDIRVEMPANSIWHQRQAQNE
ncbi:MAG: hypothetical protein ACL7AY_08810 [Candidatus Arsenophonus phytopathogenicus]